MSSSFERAMISAYLAAIQSSFHIAEVGGIWRQRDKGTGDYIHFDSAGGACVRTARPTSN